jgi:hypothetical protein
MRAGESPEAGRNGGTEQSKKSELDPCDGEPEPGIAHAASVSKHQDPAPRRRLRTHVTDGSNEFGRRRWCNQDGDRRMSSSLLPPWPGLPGRQRFRQTRPRRVGRLSQKALPADFPIRLVRIFGQTIAKLRRQEEEAEDGAGELLRKPDTGRMSLDTPALRSSSGPALPSVRPSTCLSCGPADAHRLARRLPQFGPAPAYRAVPRMLIALRLLTVRPSACSPSGPAPAHHPARRLPTVRPCACSLSASRGVAGDVARRGIGIAGRVRIARWCGAPIRGLAQPEMTSESPLAVAGRTAARDPRPRRGRVCSLTADAGRPNPEVVVLSNDYCECLIPAWALSSIRIDIQPPHQRRAEQGLAR